MDVNKDYNLMVGLRIRELRETLHMTRDVFSERCDISPSFLAAVESGRKGITAKTICKICMACDVSADYIVLGRNQGFKEDIFLELIDSLSKNQRDDAIQILSIFTKSVKRVQDK